MNNNFFNGQQTQSGYFSYPYGNGYPTAIRQDTTAYVYPQTAGTAFIKGRPVSSLEEARVAQIDLDGSVFIFPDLGNKKIYTKRINADGTASLQSFVLASEPAPEETSSEYATKNEIEELKKTLTEIIAKLKKSNVELNF